MTICPVCDLQINDERALEQRLVTEYQGIPYYFCSNACQQRFDREPERYMGQSVGRHWLEDVEAGLDR